MSSVEFEAQTHFEYQALLFDPSLLELSPDDYCQLSVETIQSVWFEMVMLT